MNEKEGATDMSVLYALLMRVSRAFFNTQQIVVLDQLMRQEEISDENLAKNVGLTVKEIHRLCGTLKEACLIKTSTITEPKKSEQQQRTIPRTCYYIDWQQIVNVIKWKICKIREMVNDCMKNELENKGYLCTGCKKTFTPLEIRELFDQYLHVFLCDVCGTELIHNDNAENVKETEKLHGRFMEQSQPIIDLLKKIDKLKIPASTFPRGPNSKGSGSGSTQDQDMQNSQNGNLQTGDFHVVLKSDNEASKAERQAELEKKRQQNELPIWHVVSTVSGEVMISNNNKVEIQEDDDQKNEIGRNQVSSEFIEEVEDGIEDMYLSPEVPNISKNIIEEEDKRLKIEEQYYGNGNIINNRKSNGTHY
ncbi:14588_t:CDS:2 [Entrophospora sp. SA101]|nr:3542_t:CDS:2 [Entrophospora sp. SA101]CAJ0832236.1 14588_t:CDS:2 [Entrophospora sp. SA101]